MQTKERAKELFSELIYDGINVDVIHADRTQLQVSHLSESKNDLSLIFWGVQSFAVLVTFVIKPWTGNDLIGTLFLKTAYLGIQIPLYRR